MSEARRRPIDVLIVGAGMHVCGRGTRTCGTVLPAIVQAHRDGLVGRMAVAATSAKSVEAFGEKLAILNGRLGAAARFDGYPATGEDPQAWRQALAEIGTRGCVIIVVPDDLHVPIAMEAVRRRLPVLVEKPLAPTLAEARALVELADQLGVYGAVDFHKRWDLANLNPGFRPRGQAPAGDGDRAAGPLAGPRHPGVRCRPGHGGVGHRRRRRALPVRLPGELEDVRSLHDGERTPADLAAIRPTLRQALVSTAVVEAVNRSLAADGRWTAIERVER